jgi:hypothetical protein
MQLFDCKSKAEAWHDELKEQFNYDYIEVKVMPIIEGSLIGA